MEWLPWTIQVGQCNENCPYKRETWRFNNGRCDNGCRNWAMWSWAKESWMPLEVGRGKETNCPLQFLEGTRPATTSITHKTYLGFLTSRTVREYICVVLAPKFAIICYTSNRKPTGFYVTKSIKAFFPPLSDLCPMPRETQSAQQGVPLPFPPFSALPVCSGPPHIF